MENSKINVFPVLLALGVLLLVFDCDANMHKESKTSTPPVNSVVIYCSFKEPKTGIEQQIELPQKNPIESGGGEEECKEVVRAQLHIDKNQPLPLIQIQKKGNQEKKDEKIETKPRSSKSGGVEECKSELKSDSQIIQTLDKVKKIEDHVLMEGPCNSSNLLELAERKLNPTDLEKFNRMYKSLFFFDPYQVMFQNTLTSNRQLSEPEQFNNGGQFPFDGYFAAQKDLKGQDPLELKSILNAHRAILSKKSINSAHRAELRLKSPPQFPENSEGALDKHLGTIRNDCWGFSMPEEDYLSGFTKEHEVQLSHGQLVNGGVKVKNSDAIKANPFLSYDRSSLQKMVLYPCVKTKEDLERFIKGNPGRIGASDQKKLQKAFSRSSTHIQRYFTEALLDREIEILRKVLSNSDSSREDILIASARFYRNMVGIHPFPNGNGRTSRLIVESVLTQKGINPPLNFHWGEDVLMSENSFVKMFQDAVAQSDHLHQDACKKIEQMGINSINISSIFETPKNRVSLSDYFEWVKKEDISLDLDPRTRLSDEELKTLVSPHLTAYKNSLLGKPVDLNHLRETELDPRVMAIGRERRLVEKLSTKTPSHLKKVFSWQPLENIEYYTKYGQTNASLNLDQDIIPSQNYAGNGLYVDLSASGSNEFAGKNKGLMVVNLDGEDPLVDLKDANNLGKLHENGLSALDLYHMNSGNIISYNSTGKINSNWMVIKKPIPKKNFHRATYKDFAPHEITRIIARILPSNTFARSEMDIILKDAKREYLTDIRKNPPEIGPYWTPFGECFQKTEKVPSRECEKKPGVVYEFDNETDICHMLALPHKAFIELAMDKRCEEHKATPSTLIRAPGQEDLLPLDTPRSEEEMEKLVQYHLRYRRTPEGDIKGYEVLGKNQYGATFAKRFKNEDEAFSYLKRIPHPIDMGRYVDRTLRNQKYFKNNMDQLAKELNQHRVGSRFESKVTSNANVIRSSLIEKVKHTAFLTQNPTKAFSFMPGYEFNKDQAITLRVRDESELLLVKNFLKKIDGFVVKLKPEGAGDHLTYTESIREGKGHTRLDEDGDRFKDFGKGTTVISGYQDGTPIILNIQYQDSVPASYQGQNETLNNLKEKKKETQQKQRQQFKDQIAPEILKAPQLRSK
jgi:hypothetical protein